MTAAISWIVATHNPATLQRHLLPTVPTEDELVVVEDAPSIAIAYNVGGGQASHPIRVFIHHDVAILDPPRLRAQLIEHCTTAVGIVGVIGSRDPVVPWWEGDRLGSCVDTRFGRLDFGPGGPCSMLDGLLLATAHNVRWDESYPGWHLYDHDICRQALDADRTNWCLDDGAKMVRHNTTGTSRMAELDGWAEATAMFHTKWGIVTAYP